MKLQLTLTSLSPHTTRTIAGTLGSFLNQGDVIALSGDLGAGKTTFTGGLASALSIKEHVISPTFNIMREYHSGRLPLFHIDAYRLEDGNADIGLEEFIDDGGISVIEWPQYIAEFIPESALFVNIFILDGDTRRIEFNSDNIRFIDLFKLLEETFK